jgi:hypothetical protein
MSAKSKVNTEAQDQIFEIIELAIDDLELLTRAFNVISEVCEETSHPELRFDDIKADLIIH